MQESIKTKCNVVYKILIIAILLVMVATFTYIVITKIIYPIKYYDYVKYACNKYQVPTNLVMAVIKQESDFNSNAISNKNAKGLMQLIDTTAQEMAAGIENIDPLEYNIYEPFVNISIGTKYLKVLLDKYDNNIYLTLIAYNAGMGNVDEWKCEDNNYYTTYSDVVDIVQFDQTKVYLYNVLHYMNMYSKIYNM